MDSDDGYISIEPDLFYRVYDSWRTDKNLEDSVEVLIEFDNLIGLKFMDKTYDDGAYMFDMIDREKWFLSKIKYGL